ncbi:MAG: VPDSG-CTERM sorting domain-containing protein [Lentisphaerae bacterium]|nr:VPDSG-CTERM sorting domain-containing protein [Lentisphaerota bacterium]
MKTARMVAGLMAVACLMGLTQTASAILLDTSSTEYLGYINDGIPSSPSDEATYINSLIGMPAPSGPTQIGSERYTRSSNPLPPGAPLATAAGSIKDDGGSNTGDFGSGYTYLIAKYDGPNYGSVVWYVGGLSGLFELPATLPPSRRRGYGISHWSLFNPHSTPDGGATAMLLGVAMLGLAAIKRLVG